MPLRSNRPPPHQHAVRRPAPPPRPTLDYAGPGPNPTATPRKLSDRAVALLNALNFAAGTFCYALGLGSEDSIHWRFLPIFQLLIGFLFMGTRKRVDGLFWFATANLFFALVYLYVGLQGAFVT